jgi:hypothetical protein
VSSELERLLREAREALPEPDEPATISARQHVLGTLRRGRARTRGLVVTAATLVAIVALGVTAGSLNAPTGAAAREPATLGFVPEPGWFALQSSPPAVQGQQTVAVAANVPFARDDTVHGLVESSGLPYSTLLRLSPRGIVIVATAVPDTDPHVASIPTNPIYAKAELPLHVRDAVPFVQWGAQVRPDQPLASYQLRAEINGVKVDVTLYFGTSTPTSAQRAAAQRQLGELVIHSEPATEHEHTAGTTIARAMPAVIDRTYSCATVLLGGVYRVETRAHSGRHTHSQWATLPYAVVGSGGVARTPFDDSAPSNSLAWVTAGMPSGPTTVDDDWLAFAVHVGGTLGVNRMQCNPADGRVPLSSAGLRGGVVGSRTEAFYCDAPRRILVRFRAIVRSSTALRTRARLFLATNAPATSAQLAVRTPTGKQLVYATVSETEKAELFTADRCTPK